MVSKSAATNTKDENRNSPSNKPPDVPRWVKVSGMIVVVLLLLFVIKVLIFGGEHGPSRHFQSGEPIQQEQLIDQVQSGEGNKPHGGSY